MMTRFTALKIVVCIAIGGFCMTPLHAASALSGAVFTTNSTGTAVNGNIYSKKTDVYLNGGPPANAPSTAAGLPDGDYYFQVTDPSGSSLLSVDSLAQRNVRVSKGVFSAYLGKTHVLGTGTSTGSIRVALFPYDITPNAGGEYKVWVTRVADYSSASGVFGFQSSKSKTDNFKVTTPSDTVPPTFSDVPAPVQIEQTALSGTAYNMPMARAFDDTDPAPVVTSDAPFVFPLGKTIVTYTATDASGNVAVSSSTVTVVDTIVPVFCWEMRVEQANLAGTKVNFPWKAMDICDAAPKITSDAPAIFPLGKTKVIFTATDASGNAAKFMANVTVVDTRGPCIMNLVAVPNVLDKPDHKMVPITLTANVTDICDVAPSYKIISVCSNEPVNGLGDGDTGPDWEITGKMTVNLRAERSGKGTGRIYTIKLSATDASGNCTAKNVTVTVPKPKEICPPCICDDSDKEKDMGSKTSEKGNNGVGNGVDPQPPGNPKPNDVTGTSPGSPASKPVVTGNDSKAVKSTPVPAAQGKTK